MGRLRYNPEAKKTLQKSNFVVNDPSEVKGKWNKTIFKNDNDIEIEIGMGKGNFIFHKSSFNPHTNFIGIEKFPSVQYKILKTITKSKQNIPNLKLIIGDAEDILNWFSKKEVNKIYINHPDPWPKEKHTKRRLVNLDFIKKFSEILKTKGEIEFKTDNLGLFEFAIEEFKSIKEFKIDIIYYNLHEEKTSDIIIMTEYEQKYFKQGKNIYYLKVIKE